MSNSNKRKRKRLKPTSTGPCDHFLPFFSPQQPTVKTGYKEYDTLPTHKKKAKDKTLSSIQPFLHKVPPSSSPFFAHFPFLSISTSTTMSEIPEIPDYNKIYNTSSYSSPHPLDSVPHPQIQSTAMSTNPHPSQPMKTTVNNSSSYGPLDYGYGMTPVSTTHTNSTVNMTPFQAPASSNDQQHASSSGSAGQGHRRSSMSNLFNSMVGVNNSQQIPMRKTVSQSATTNINNSGRRRSSIAKFLMPDPQPNGGGASLGRRRSSAFTSLGYKTDAGGDEHKG